MVGTVVFNPILFLRYMDQFQSLIFLVMMHLVQWVSMILDILLDYISIQMIICGKVFFMIPQILCIPL